MIKGKRYQVSLTLERLKEVLHYDPETGVWTRLKDIAWTKAGERAGSPRPNGRYIGLDRGGYYSSNLAWFYMTGQWPTELIDHKNGDNQDDRWTNLRLATYSQNLANSKNQSGKTLPKGVRLFNGRYIARIGHKVEGRKILYHLGSFDTVDQAHEAYKEAAERIFQEFARP